MSESIRPEIIHRFRLWIKEEKMGKKIVVLSSSPRKGGNSDLLCDEFIQGAKEAGHTVEKIRLNEKEIHPCQGCYGCAKLGHCVQTDAMQGIIELMLEADVYVFSTPVYFYSMSGQMKVFIDRLVPAYAKMTGKEIYIFVTAWDANPRNLESTVEAVRGLTRDCFEGAIEKGVLLGGGVTDKGEIRKTAFLQQAYQLGKNA